MGRTADGRLSDEWTSPECPAEAGDVVIRVPTSRSRCGDLDESSKVVSCVSPRDGSGSVHLHRTGDHTLMHLQGRSRRNGLSYCLCGRYPTIPVPPSARAASTAPFGPRPPRRAARFDPLIPTR